MTDFTIKRFDELEPGDIIQGTNDKLVSVVTAYDEHIPETMWEIEIDDGSFIKASGNHLWYCETQIDRELHHLRKKGGKRLLKDLTPQALNLLEESASKEEIVETRLIDMIVLTQASSNPELTRAIVRIADSIGHIAENTFTEKDLLEEGDQEDTIRSYDARLFAQQILALTGQRKYRKYHLIVGSIMTTDQMIELGDMVDIPVTTMLG